MSFKKKFETAHVFAAALNMQLDICKPCKHDSLHDELVVKFGGTAKTQYRYLNIYNDGVVVGKWIVKYNKVTGMKGEYYHFIQHVNNMYTDKGISIESEVFNCQFDKVKSYLLNAGKEQE